MNPPKNKACKAESKNGAATLGVPRGVIVPPVLKEVSKLAVGVAAVATGSATGNPRNKCSLQPGHSLMDWIRLGQSGQDLTGVGERAGKLSISPKQLAEHSTEKDAWIALRGRVYNITTYLSFHPGGPAELMKGAGKDATGLFNQVHAWVNFESILHKCLIGRLSSLDSEIDTAALFLGTEGKTNIKSLQNEKNLDPNSVRTSNGNTTNSPNAKSKTISLPRFDWIQKMDNITAIFYTNAFSNPQVRITTPTKQNLVTIYLTYNGTIYDNTLHFSNNTHWPCKVNINNETGKVEVTFKKITPNIWENYGLLNQSCSESGVSGEKVKYVVVNKVQANHNTTLLSLQRLDGHKQMVPVGQHVFVFGKWNGDEISRSYTPIPSSLIKGIEPETRIGDVCLLVKRYPQGMLSPFICNRKTGDTLELSSPQGPFDLRSIENKEAFLLVAAGTGITPMLGFLLCVLERRTRRCQKVTLMFFNRKEEDILLKDQLDKLVKTEERLEVQYILSEPSSSWKGDKGHISDSCLKSAIDRQCSNTQLFPADIFVTICGPTAFSNLTQSLLNDMGYQQQHMYSFVG